MRWTARFEENLNRLLQDLYVHKSAIADDLRSILLELEKVLPDKRL